MQKKNQKSYFNQININIQKLLIFVLKFTQFQILENLNNYFNSFQDEIKTKRKII